MGVNLLSISMETLLYFITMFFDFLTETTVLGVPILSFPLFGFVVLCVYRFVLSPFLSGGVSITASDSAKMAGNAMKNANNHNKTNIRNL